jgi:hypothetical protein
MGHRAMVTLSFVVFLVLEGAFLYWMYRFFYGS